MAIKAPKVFGNRGATEARLTGGQSITSPASGWDAPVSDSSPGTWGDMIDETNEVADAVKRRRFDEAGVGGKAKMLAKGLAKGAVDKVANAPVVSSGPDGGRSLRMPGMTYARAMSGDPTAQMELAEKAAQRINSTMGRGWNAAAVGYQHGLNAAWSQEPNKAMLMSGNNLGQSDVLGEWRHKASPPKLPLYKDGGKQEAQGEQQEEGPTTPGRPGQDEVTRRKTDWTVGTPDRRSDPRKGGPRTSKPTPPAPATPTAPGPGRVPKKPANQRPLRPKPTPGAVDNTPSSGSATPTPTRRGRKPYDPNRPRRGAGGEQITGLLEPMSPEDAANARRSAEAMNDLLNAPQGAPLPRPPKNYRTPKSK